MREDLVSVIVVAYNEEKNIKDCLESLTKQSYCNYEVIIIDGNSSDGTLEICKDYCKKFSNFKVYINPEKFIAKSRNIGIQKSKGDLIAFTDADCIVPVNWLKVLLTKYFMHVNGGLKIGGVGGANIAPKNSNRISKAISVIQSSRLGFVGSVQGQVFQSDREVKSISCSNSLFNKVSIIEVGGFNEFYKNMGEDYELGYRLRKNDYRLYAVADSFVWHKLRNSYTGFAKNMFNYGKGRMNLMINLSEYRLIYLIPLFFIFSILISFFIAPIFLFLLIMPLSYLIVILMYSFFLSFKENDLFFEILLAFVILHFSYSMGELYGLFRQRLNNPT